MKSIAFMGFLVGICLLLVHYASAGRLQQKRPDSSQSKERWETRFAATDITREPLSDAQKAHSEYFAGYFTGADLPRIQDKLAGFEEDRLRISAIVDRYTPVYVSADEYLTKMTEESECVVLGRLLSKTSYLSSDGTFVFSDYTVMVQRTLKADSGSPAPGRVITVSVPGGVVRIDGVTVSAALTLGLPLEAVSDDVLLFLKFIPKAGVYGPIYHDATFAIAEGEYRQLRSESPVTVPIVKLESKFK